LLLCAAEILAPREILLLVSCSKRRGLIGKLPQREMPTELPTSFLWRSSEMEFAVRPRRGAGS
jgi:hypothetical protein